MQRTPRTSCPARPRRATATLALCVAACLAVTGCATPPPPAVAFEPAPAVDGRARYDADLQDCRDRARQVGVLSETLDAVVQGALVAAFVAWGLGRSDTGVRDWALTGGALAGGAQGLQALERRRQLVAHCMAVRGHRISPLAVAEPPPPYAPTPPSWIASPPTPPRPTGADAYSAERLAREQACHAQPVATLAAKGPGFETYNVPCSNGDALAIRCEFGNCRMLR